jgi:hypothetical protein
MNNNNPPRTLTIYATRIIADVVDRAVKQPDPVIAARTTARSARIIGRMLEDMSERLPLLEQPSAWATRVASFMWGVVEVAVPGSLGQILFHHWTKLAAALAVAMIVIGLIPGAGGVERAGIVVLALTAIVNIIVLALNRMLSARPWIHTLLWAPLVLGAAITVWCAWSIRDTGVTAPLWRHPLLIIGWFAVIVSWAGLAAAQGWRKPGVIYVTVVLPAAAVAFMEFFRHADAYVLPSSYAVVEWWAALLTISLCALFTVLAVWRSRRKAFVRQHPVR